MESHKVVLHRVVFSVAMLLACLACSGPKPVAKGPDPMNELKEWTVSGVGTGISIRTVAKGADATDMARAWSAPGSSADERAGIAAWLLVYGGDAFPRDLWLDRLLEANRIRSEEMDGTLTSLPLVLGDVFLETKSPEVLDALISARLDGAPSENQSTALFGIFLAQPERLDSLFAPADSRPGAKALRWAITTELDSPDSETAKALVALRDRQDLPNFGAFLAHSKGTP